MNFKEGYLFKDTAFSEMSPLLADTQVAEKRSNAKQMCKLQIVHLQITMFLRWSFGNISKSSGNSKKSVRV